MNRFGANHFAVIQHLNGYVTLFTVGGEHAVCYGTKRIIRKSPGNAFFGKFCRRTGSINTGDFHGGRGTGRIVIISGVQNSMVEFAGGFCFGNQDNTVDGGTFGTVGRDGTHGVCGFPFPFGNKGGRSATVTVHGVYAAQREHHFAQFVVGKTGGNRRVTAVYQAEYQGTVGFDTDHRTGSIGGGTFYGFGYQLSVFNNPVKVGGNGIPFGTVQRRAHGTKFAVAFFINGQIGLGAFVYFGSTQNNPIHYHVTVGSVRVISQGGVHGTHNVITQTFVVSYGFGYRFSFPVLSFILNTVQCQIVGIQFIDPIITGQNFNVLVFGVNLKIVNYLTVVPGFVVENHFGFGGPGSKIISVFGHFNKIIPGNRRIKLSQGRQRQYGKNHKCCQCQCN